MNDCMPSHIIELNANNGLPAFKALASQTRLKILSLLTDRDMNINELSLALKIAQPSVTKHVQILEDAGLVVSDYAPGAQGTQKRCRRSFDRCIVNFEDAARSTENVAEIEMPIGLYSIAEPKPTCGLASRTGWIGLLDEPVSFQFPQRAEAQILWMADGFVEYVFPNTLEPSVKVVGLELMMEIASETPGYDNDFPSDITLWINGIEIGSWRSPGDMGGCRGRLNPSWWADNLNQFGFLKSWMVDGTGSYVDGIPISQVTIDQLGIEPYHRTTVRIGIKEDAACHGGFTLFGKGFGNYEQDLLLRLRHSRKAKG